MSKASIETYIKQLQTGAVQNNEEKIYRAINENAGITINTLRQTMAHQTVTATVSSLQDLGVVYVNGIERTEESSFSKLYIESDPEKIRKNRKDRKSEKFRRWLKRGEEYHEFLDPFVSTSLSIKLDEIKAYG